MASTQDCGFLGPEVGKCSADERYPGLWEVPLWAIQEADTNYGFSGGVGGDGGVRAATGQYSFVLSSVLFASLGQLRCLPPFLRGRPGAPALGSAPAPPCPHRTGINNPKLEGAPLTDDLAGLLKRQLDARLAGNRAPLQISTFYEWLGDKPKNCATDADPNCFQVMPGSTSFRKHACRARHGPRCPCAGLPVCSTSLC